MSWAKIDDRLFVHPKFLSISLSAAGLWVFGLSYAASLERDGWFPYEALSRLTVTPDCESFAHELVHAGLWLREPDGYRIHDFLKYNFSRKRLITKRKLDAKRQRQSRARHGVTRRGVVAESTTPVPSRPVPSQKSLTSFERKRRSRTLPESETLTPERLEMARDAGLTEVEARRQWRLFGLHEFRDPHSDWTRAWHKWVLNSIEYARTKPGRSRVSEPPRPTGPSSEETREMLRDKGILPPTALPFRSMS